MQFEKSPRCCAQLHPGCNLHKNKLENKAEFIFEYQTLKNAVNKSWLNEENHIPFVQNYAPNDVLERKFGIPGGMAKHLVDLSAKDMYTILMFTNDIKPKSIDYWLYEYLEVNIDLSGLRWLTGKNWANANLLILIG